ncbi:MAG: ABC transporter ATP-binding protein, partial [Sphingobacteriales bacterium UTBCD1]
MRFPYFKQPDAMDCGPTCLRMVAKHYGRSISLQSLREKTQIGKEGVNLLGISEAAEVIGFRTQAIKLTYQSLTQDAKLPAILHWNQNHFVILYKVKKRFLLRRNDRSHGNSKLLIADPAKGLITLSPGEFKNNWISNKENGQEEGIALLLEPSPKFYENTDV